MSSWSKLVNPSLLLVWLSLTIVIVTRHEKWADEAQAWLLARDLDLPTLWLKELRYEGHPGLWHTLLWIAQRAFHLPYSLMGFMGLSFAAAGVAFLLFKSPFPGFIRWLLAFSYFIVYQYAVIARPYVLLPLLAFAAAYFFADHAHPERITAVLILLCNLTLHCFLLAACFGIAYAWQIAQRWKSLPQRTRIKFWACCGAMLLTALWVFAVLKPPPDVLAVGSIKGKGLSQIGDAMWFGINGAFFDCTTITIVWLGVLGVWCYGRKNGSLILLSANLVMLGLLYGLSGAGHHQGTILVATFASLWVGWPTEQEKSIINRQWSHRILIVLLIGLLGYHVYNASVAIANDYRYPYSSGEDAARFLHSVDAEHHRVVGYFSLTTEVQACFDHNIFLNSPTSYYHFGYHGPANVVEDITTYRPDYVILSCNHMEINCDEMTSKLKPVMNYFGYALIHRSHGYLFFKQSHDDSEGDLIYGRM